MADKVFPYLDLPTLSPRPSPPTSYPLLLRQPPPLPPPRPASSSPSARPLFPILPPLLSPSSPPPIRPLIASSFAFETLLDHLHPFTTLLRTSLPPCAPLRPIPHSCLRCPLVLLLLLFSTFPFIAASFAFETLLDLRQFAALLCPSLPPALEGVVSHDKFLKAPPTAASFIAASFAFETLLDLRQFAALLRPSLPPSLEGVVGQDKFLKARAYSLDRARLGFVRGAVDFCVELLMLKLFVLPWLWEDKFLKARAYSLDRARLGFVRGAVDFCVELLMLKLFVLPWLWELCALDYQLPYLWGINGRNEIEHSILFLFASSLISQVVDLPFALYSTFVIEHRHGFNKQTLLGFIKDRILGILLMVVILPPVLGACIRIVQVGGNLVAVYLWLFMLAFSLFMLTIYPVAIAPLFNKFTPLEAGTLRSKIEGLAGSLSYPLKKIFVMDGSQRSAHSNAYLYGFFKNKRIVLYDTLLSHCKDDEEEVVVVIAHELGHL
ncbi:unnamed protein product [Closterium sp. Naga37s-1]|nr:unnamed protein product [Closterium sp. Naga37s-1]